MSAPINSKKFKCYEIAGDLQLRAGRPVLLRGQRNGAPPPGPGHLHRQHGGMQHIREPVAGRIRRVPRSAQVHHSM